jgi:peptidoglycan/xylan/chitin deacetylase (PgdA/CDA1 family)
MAEGDRATTGMARSGTGGTARNHSLFGSVRPAASLPQPGIDDAVIDRLGPQLGHALAKRLAFRTVPIALDRPVMSITFDDFPASAHERGAALLEGFGARGTFFTATGLLGWTTPLWTIAGPEAVVDLHRRGHEIGLHTHSHRAVFDMDARAFEADLAANRAALRRLVPGLVRETFAYPFGFAGYQRKRQLSRLARASRAVQPGINAGELDPDFVKAVELVDCGLTAAELTRLLDETVACRGWLVFLTHDIAAEPSRFGASPALLEAALAGARAAGIEILPVSAALDRIGVA